MDEMNSIEGIYLATPREERRETIYTGQNYSNFDGASYKEKAKESMNLLEKIRKSEEERWKNRILIEDSQTGDLYIRKHQVFTPTYSNAQYNRIMGIEDMIDQKRYKNLQFNQVGDLKEKGQNIDLLDINISETDFDKGQISGEFYEMAKPTKENEIHAKRLIKNMRDGDMDNWTEGDYKTAISYMKFSTINNKKTTGYKHSETEGVFYSTAEDMMYQKDGKIDMKKIKEKSKEFAKYTDSGLANLNKNGREQKEIADRLNDFLTRNQNELFMSQNSSRYDQSVISTFLTQKLEKEKVAHYQFEDLKSMLRVFDVEGRKDIPEAITSLLENTDKERPTSNRRDIINLSLAFKDEAGFLNEMKTDLEERLNPKTLIDEQIMNREILEMQRGELLKGDLSELIGDYKNVEILDHTGKEETLIRQGNKSDYTGERIYQFSGIFTKETDSSQFMLELFDEGREQSIRIHAAGDAGLDSLERLTLEGLKPAFNPGIVNKMDVPERPDLYVKPGDEWLGPETTFFKEMKAPSSQTAGESFKAFRGFQIADSYYSLDIETMGDTTSNNFSITEVSIDKYNKKGELIEKGFNPLVRPEDATIERLKELHHEYSVDSTAINRWTDTERRTFVDAMRYSSVEGEGISRFNIDFNGNITHNSLVEDHLTKDGRIEYSLLFEKKEEYVKHAKSGIEQLENWKYDSKQLARDMRDFLNKTSSEVYLTYNGRSFDFKVMDRFFKLKGETVEMPPVHLDMYQLLKAIDPDKKELSKILGTEVDDLRLQTLVAGFADEGSKHSASADTEVLAKFTSSLEDYLAKEIEDIKSGKRDPEEVKFKVDDDFVRTGDQFKVKKSHKAYQDSDHSFISFFDEELGKTKVPEYGNMGWAIESGAHYEFRGLYDISEGNEKKYAMKMKNVLTGSESYIVRSGLHAENDIAGILHTNFEPSTVSKEQLLKDREALERDRARRAYDRIFDYESGGQGVYFDKEGDLVRSSSVGFEGAKKFYGAAFEEDRMEKALASLDKETWIKQTEEFIKNQGADVPAREELERRFDLYKEEAPKELMEDVYKRRNFSEKDIQYYEKFKGRLKDELPVYQEAISQIESHFEEDMHRATVLKDSQMLKEVAMAQTGALYQFHKEVEGYVEEQGGAKELVEGATTQKKYFRIQDYRGQDISLNISDYDTARSAVFRHARKDIHESKRNLQREKDGLIELVNAMTYSKSIDKDLQGNLIDMVHRKTSTYDAAGEIANVFFEKSDMKGVEIETVREVAPTQSNSVLNQIESGKEFAQERINPILEEASRKKTRFIVDPTTKKIQLDMSDEMAELVGGRYSVEGGAVQGRGNVEAIEHVVNRLGVGRGGFDDVAINVVDDGQGLRAEILAYDKKDHAAVVKGIETGTGTSKAFKITLPLVNDEGVQKIGGLISNSHMYGYLDRGELNVRNSVEELALNVSKKLGYISKMYEEGDIDKANRAIEREILKEFQQQAGVSREASQLSLNDQMTYQGNASDYMKQSLVDIEDASIRHFYEEGYKGNKLTDSDFHDSAFYYDDINQKKLKTNLTMMDLKSEAQTMVKSNQIEWFNEMMADKGLTGYISGVKSDKAGKYVSLLDGRDSIIFGAYSDAKRDNMIQWTNAHRMNPTDMEALTGVNDISFTQSVVTPIEEAVDGGSQSNYRMTANFAIMDDDMITKQIKHLATTEEGAAILRRSNILNDDGSFNWDKAPRTFEQQLSVSEDVHKHLNVERKKTFQSDRIDLAPSVEMGSVIQPGEVAGYEIRSDGQQVPIVNERHTPATLSGMDLEQGKIEMSWTERAHKAMIGGDKGTMIPYKQELLDAITGMDNISYLFQPDVAKHKDFNLLFSGEVLKLTERAQAAKGSEQKAMIQALESAGIGIEWDQENNRFRDLTNTKGLAPGEDYTGLVKKVDELFENPLFSDIQRSSTTQYADGTSQTTHGYRTQVLLSGVYEHTKYFDQEGRKYLSHTFDEAGNLDVQYLGHQKGGVRLGHRELRSISNLGMDNFYNFVMEEMKQRDIESGYGKNMPRSEYILNIQSAVENMSTGPQEGDRIFRYTDFKELPGAGGVEEEYKGTIFDDKHVQSMSGRKDGFWLELPTESHLGVDIKPEITTPEGKQEIDKVFIPHTQQNYTDGRRYNDNLQKIVQNIINQAQRADEAESMDDRRRTIQQIGKSVDELQQRFNFDLTSSKGLMGDLVTAEMGGAAHGVTSKIISDYRSEEYKKMHNISGEFSIISKEAAIGMGIYDQLASGEEVYGAVTRYPTFNDRSTVFGQLIMDETLTGNDVHITEKQALLLNADSDGDALYVQAAPNEAVSEEFKHMSHINPNQFPEPMQKAQKHHNATLEYLAGETGESVDTLHNVIEKDDFRVLEKNTKEELASKIGKSVIGSASNYNLSLQQAAGMFYSPGSAEHTIIQDFGSAVEQKIISSKHGASSHAGDLIRALNQNNWSEVRRIDELHYDSMFRQEYDLDKVQFFMEDKINKIEGGLYNPMFSMGKGSGAVFSTAEEAVELLKHGTNSPANHFVGAARELLGQSSEPLRVQASQLSPQEGPLNFQEAHNEGFSKNIDAGKIDMKETTSHSARTGVNEELLSPKPTHATNFDIVEGGPSQQQALGFGTRSSGAAMGIGAAGIALGAMGMGMANSTTPTKEDFEAYIDNRSLERKMEEREQNDFLGSSYLGVSRYDEGVTQERNYQVQASASKPSSRTAHIPADLSRSLGFENGIDINVTDNMSNLTTNWYRDKVQEHV